jgi:hypothetical protein
MTRDEASWRWLERDHMKQAARVQQLSYLIGRLKTGDCWCGMGSYPEMGTGHSSVCMEAQRMLEAYK